MKRAVEHAEEHEFDRLEDFEMNTDNPGFEDGILGVFVYKLFKGPSHANGNAIVKAQGRTLLVEEILQAVVLLIILRRSCVPSGSPVSGVPEPVGVVKESVSHGHSAIYDLGARTSQVIRLDRAECLRLQHPKLVMVANLRRRFMKVA